MAVTTLDAKTALVLVDLQKGARRRTELGPNPLELVAQRAGRMAQAFRRCGLPVVLVNVDGGAPGRTDKGLGHAHDRPADAMDFVPELDQQPQDHVVTKRTWGAFTGTDLDDFLRGQGVTHVVIAGGATSLGVESTARQAYEHGFNVTLAIDAMTDLNVEPHYHAIDWIFPRLGEVGSTEDVLHRLDETCSRPQ